MSERKMKRVEDSLTEQSHLLMPKCLNAAGYLFGGQLLAWIDETAGIVAKRHAEMNVVTVAVDNMYFKAGAKVNDTIVLIGRLTHVGRSSMEVRIDTYCEALDGTRTMINRAYFTMVGTDENQHPVEVPGLIIEGVNTTDWRTRLPRNVRNSGKSADMKGSDLFAKYQMFKWIFAIRFDTCLIWLNYRIYCFLYFECTEYK